MALQHHPQTGLIVICDYSIGGFVKPEMVKRRPVVIVSPRLRRSEGLCTVVPLSTVTPDPVMQFHYELTLDPPLPPPYESPTMWVKGDMITSVALRRLFMPFKGKDGSGKRKYFIKILQGEEFNKIQECVLCALGLNNLTQHL